MLLTLFLFLFFQPGAPIFPFISSSPVKTRHTRYSRHGPLSYSSSTSTVHESGDAHGGPRYHVENASSIEGVQPALSPDSVVFYQGDDIEEHANRTNKLKPVN